MLTLMSKLEKSNSISTERKNDLSLSQDRNNALNWCGKRSKSNHQDLHLLDQLIYPRNKRDRRSLVWWTQNSKPSPGGKIGSYPYLSFTLHKLFLLWHFYFPTIALENKIKIPSLQHKIFKHHVNNVFTVCKTPQEYLLWRRKNLKIPCIHLEIFCSIIKYFLHSIYIHIYTEEIQAYGPADT